MSKGGGYDTSGMEAAARESNALQREMYEASVARGEPFYKGGVEGFQTLLDYMGLEGGNARQSRESIYNELLPQYTRQETSGTPGMYVDKFGNIVTEAGAKAAIFNEPAGYEKYTIDDVNSGKYKMINNVSDITQFGYTPFQTQQEVIDYDGLNASLEQRLADQEAAGVPDYYGSLLQPFGMDQFEADPSYAFRQAEGQKAIERSMAARGQSFTPAAIKELQNYNQNLASQEYGNAFNRYNIDQGNVYNRLAGIAGMGQQQVAQLDQAGQSYAGNVGATNSSLANAQASAAQAEAAQKGSMFNTLLGVGGQIGAAYLTGGGSLAASDINTKENINYVGQENGHKMYEFNYKGDDIRYKGVMAQDVQLTHPNAVKDIDGVLHVNYGQLGVNMEVV